ncbi:MAG: hypothetical protein CL526_12275 [Aequorivita sp.]|nr:hypothetical protein [Aequorivita sp.]|tara:strand:- start:74579 stop:75574 length:996 start_codon:yes stop_codon:yes gene_type:complete
MKRPKKFKFSLKTFINDFWTHIYGFITIVSFLTAIGFTVITLNKEQVPFKDVLYVSLGLIAILVFVIVRISAKYSQLHSMSSDLMNYERENENLIGLIQLQAETFHNITHYYRSLIYSVDKVLLKISKKEEIKQKEIDYLSTRNNHFLIMLTSSLQNYFSIYTDDSCSICIKILNGNKIKTLFRDPVSLKKRRQAELTSGNQIYSTSDNTAFDLITSPNWKEFYYMKDDLESEYKSHRYKNSNPSWNNYYNATIVVPISKLNDGLSDRNILGFLTVDNQQGYLVDETSKEFMLGISDLLYNYVYKHKLISKFTKENNFKYDKQDEYIWDQC